MVQNVLIAANVLGYACGLSLQLAFCSYADAFCKDFCNVIGRIATPFPFLDRHKQTDTELRLDAVKFLATIHEYRSRSTSAV